MAWLGGSTGWSIICTQKVVGLIPGQDTYLGCGSIPGQGIGQGINQSMFLSHIAVSLSLSLSLSLINKNISSGANFTKRY